MGHETDLEIGDCLDRIIEIEEVQDMKEDAGNQRVQIEKQEREEGMNRERGRKMLGGREMR